MPRRRCSFCRQSNSTMHRHEMRHSTGCLRSWRSTRKRSRRERLRTELPMKFSHRVTRPRSKKPRAPNSHSDPCRRVQQSWYRRVRVDPGCVPTRHLNDAKDRVGAKEVPGVDQDHKSGCRFRKLRGRGGYVVDSGAAQFGQIRTIRIARRLLPQSHVRSYKNPLRACRQCSAAVPSPRCSWLLRPMRQGRQR